MLVSDGDGRIWEFIAHDIGSFNLVSKVWAGSGAGFAERLTIAAADLNGDGDDDAIGGLANGGLVMLVDPRVGRPAALSAISGASSILLTWDPNRQSRIAGYYVYRGLANVGPWTRLIEPFLVNPEYVDPVAPGVPFFYYVTSLTGSRLPGNSALNLIESAPSDVVQSSAGRVTLIAQRSRAAPGGQAQVLISVDNAYRISGSELEIRVSYDAEILSPITQSNSNQDTTTLSGLSQNLVISDNAETADGELIITGSGGTMEPGAGNIFRLWFLVDAAASLGFTSNVQITAASMRDVDGNLLTVTILNEGVVDVDHGYFLGDVNGDGILSFSDRAYLRILMRSSSEPTPEELQAGDLNGDGELNRQDWMLIMRLLRGNPIHIIGNP